MAMTARKLTDEQIDRVMRVRRIAERSSIGDVYVCPTCGYMRHTMLVAKSRCEMEIRRCQRCITALVSPKEQFDG